MSTQSQNLPFTQFLLPLNAEEEEQQLFHEGMDSNTFPCVPVAEDMPQAELCRACAKSSKFMVPIYSERGIQLKLEEKINRHLPINVRRNDILPLQMCINCVLRLDAFHHMTESCYLANKKLQIVFSYKEGHFARTNSRSTRFLRQKGNFEKPSTSTKENDDANTENSFNCDIAVNNIDCDAGMKSATTVEDINADIEIIENKPKRPVKQLALYKCPVCSVIIKGQLNLKSHLSNVHNKVQCNDCHDLFDNGNDFQIHITDQHKNVCEYCNLIFISRKQQHSHFAAVHSDLKLYKCDECEKQFPLAGMLAQHQRFHELKSMHLECKICGKVLKNLDSYARHQLVHLPESEKNRYLCSECGKVYHNAWQLKHHMRDHTGEAPYQCDKCPKSFRQPQNLRIHKNVHVQGRPHGCDKCDSAFKHKRHLSKHKKDCHEGKWNYKCILCSNIFETESQVKIHYATHNSEEILAREQKDNNSECSEQFIKVSDFQCDLCKKFFITAGMLSNHKQVHKRRKYSNYDGTTKSRTRTEVSDFMCDICGKYLAQKMSLIVHLRTHMKIKPFTCDICNKGFITKGFLTHHMYTHSGEKNVECGSCSRKFFSVHDRNIHMKSAHVSARPHKCDVCDKTFKRKYNLTIHYRIHTGEKPYQCDICSRVFTQKTDLTRHRMRHTPEEVASVKDQISSLSTIDMSALSQTSSSSIIRPTKLKLSQRLAKISTKKNEINNIENISYDDLNNVNYVPSGEYVIHTDAKTKNEENIEVYIL